MEITANASQAITTGNNLLFTDTVVPGNCSILHREGSGLVTLKGTSSTQCRSRFRIVFSGNLKADASASISGITLLSLAIALNGEAIPTSTMTVTVADTTSTYNVATECVIDVPSKCCQSISVKNITSGITVDTANANLIVERIA